MTVMLRRLIGVVTGLAITLTVFAAGVVLVDGHPDRYTVKRGDTLWSISAKFLKKPWLWPEIWQVNPQVRNPHRIFPGDQLYLGVGSNGPYLGTDRLGPRVRGDANAEAIAPLPLSALKPYLKNTRILGEGEVDRAPHVVGIEDNQLRGTPGQLIYVRGLDAQPGQRFAVLRPLGRYYDLPPRNEGETRTVRRQEYEWRDGRPSLIWHHGPMEHSLRGDVRFLGYELLEYGTLEVTRAGNPASGLVTTSDFEVRAGDIVLPAEQRPYDDSYLPHAPARVPENMRIIAFSDANYAVGPTQVIALSRGAENGVENGQVYSIYRDGDVVNDQTDYPIGSFKSAFNRDQRDIQLPPEFAGHVMIFRTFNSVSYGLVMDALKPVTMGNFLYDPDSTP